MTRYAVGLADEETPSSARDDRQRQRIARHIAIDRRVGRAQGTHECGQRNSQGAHVECVGAERTAHQCPISRCLADPGNRAFRR